MERKLFPTVERSQSEDKMNRQAGEKVVKSHRGETTVEKIEKVTKTQFVLANGERYWRKSGKLVGAGDEFFAAKITTPKPGELEDITMRQWRERLSFRLRSVQLGKKDIAALKELQQLLDKYWSETK